MFYVNIFGKRREREREQDKRKTIERYVVLQLPGD